MKLVKLLSLFVIGLFATQIVLAQDDNPCRLLLQNGLYRTYNITKSGNFSQDFKSYFASDTFKQDFKSGKWNADLFAVINGTPAKLDLGSSDEQITAFQQRIRTATSFSLNQSFYEYAQIAVPDVDLAKVYSGCVRDLPPAVGFRVVPNVNERDVFFVVTYKKLSSSDPMPRVTLFRVKNGTNIIKSFTEGGLLQDSNTITADRDPNKDLSLILETNKGVVTYRVPADPSGFNKDFPVGTIITSYLSWTEFQGITQNNLNNPGGNFWSARYSKWAPADGREVPESTFLRATSQMRLPDLRGVFLRGLNSFDPEQSSTVASDRRDPDNRNRGTFQNDAFQDHTHSLPFVFFTNPPQSEAELKSGLAAGGNFGERGISRVDTPATRGASGQTQGETRPKNVAIFYYIRIN